MKQLSLLYTFFFLALILPTSACDCYYQGEFLKVAPKSKLVSLVRIKRFLTYKEIYNNRTPISMDVDIIETYKGKETAKTIIVWGDNGSLCRPYLSKFIVGNYYVIAFSEGMDGSLIDANKQERKTDYSISNCGDFYLTVDIEKQTAFGAVTDKHTLINLKELKTKFK